MVSQVTELRDHREQGEPDTGNGNVSDIVESNSYTPIQSWSHHYIKCAVTDTSGLSADEQEGVLLGGELLPQRSSAGAAQNMSENSSCEHAVLSMVGLGRRGRHRQTSRQRGADGTGNCPWRGDE